MAGNGITFDDISTGVSYEQFPKDPAAREAISIVNEKVEALKDSTVSRQDVINLENKVKQSDLDKDNFKVAVNKELTDVKAVVEGIDGGNTAKLEELEAAVNDKANKDLVDSLVYQIEGSVKQINGIAPDEEGNVAIDLNTTGLATKEEVQMKTDEIETLIFTKAERSNVEMLENNVEDLTTEVSNKASAQSVTQLTSQLAETVNVIISIDKFPRQIPEVDDTSRIQKAIDYVKSIGGGEIRFPPNLYTIKGTLIVRKNVSLVGVSQTNHETNNAGVNHNSVIFKHEPIAANTDLFIGETPQVYGYLSGISIRKINLFGTSNSRYAMKIDKAGHLEVDSLVIANGFVDGIVCDGYMHSSITNCYITNMLNTPIRFTGSISTTVSIEKCYIRGSKWASIIEAETALGVIFTDCVFESCTDGGVDIHVDNKVSFVNPYFENVPAASGAKPMIQIGVNGISRDSTRPFAVVSIVGGAMAGCNFGIDVESSAFNCDKVAMLSVTGSEMQRTGKLIKTTANTRLVVFTGINTTQVTNLKSGITDNPKVMFLGYTENGISNPYLFTSELRFNNRNKWKIAETFSQTDGDLQFTIGSSTTLWLDAQKNIRHQFTGSIGNASQVEAYGAIPTPTFAGTSVGAFMWAETINGVTQMMTRNSAGEVTPIGNQSGTTANRPTGTRRYVGIHYFDTTLGIPIYYSGSDVWKKYSDNTPT